MRYETRTAIGTSAVLNFPIALCGAIVSILHMIDIKTDVPMSLGFIYLPAFICISVFCLISVPFGARMLNRISQDRSRQIFALILILTSIKMLFF